MAITTCQPFTTYTFEVLAVNSAGSTAGAVHSATTFTVPAPGAPTWWSGTVSSSQINLAWNAVTYASRYLVEQWDGAKWNTVVTTTNTYASITGLSANWTYWFNVCAQNDSGTTWGNQNTAKTYQVPLNLTNPATYVPNGNDTALMNQNATYSVVSGTLFNPSTGQPDPIDVQQHQIGDCWLLASLAEAAQRKPALITNMIHEYGQEIAPDGKLVNVYAVNFFDGSADTGDGVGHPNLRTVYVDNELPSNGTLYNAPINSVLWVSLIEKAYVVAVGQNITIVGNVSWNDMHQTSPNNGGGNEAVYGYGVLNIGYASWALHAITGNMALEIVNYTPSDLTMDFNAGDLVCLYTVNPAQGGPSDPKLVAGHVYAVLSVTAQPTAPYRIFNPWGVDAGNHYWAYNHVNTTYGLVDCGSGFISEGQYENFCMMTICHM